MDKDKIAIVGSGDNAAEIVSRHLRAEMKGQSVILSTDDQTSVLETFEFKPIKISPMPFYRKEKSPYKCDGTLKRGRRR